MQLRFAGIVTVPRGGAGLFLILGLLAWTAVYPVAVRAAETAPAPPLAAAPSEAGDMRSVGWLENTVMRLEGEAMSDVSMLPETPYALEREWRSFDRDGSGPGALADIGWAVLAALIALAAERLVARALSWRVCRRMRLRPLGPTVPDLLLLLLCDAVGLGVFVGAFVLSRHWLLSVGPTATLFIFAANVVIRWRITALFIRAVLRPGEPAARLVDLSDNEASRLARFLSGAILAVIVLIGFSRLGLMDEDSGAPHIIALIVAGLVCALYALIVFRARGLAQALIRGPGNGIVSAMRAALARAWLPIGLTGVAGLLVFFVFGLSLGLLSYYHAAVTTMYLLFILLVLERLAERGWHEREPALDGRPAAVEHLVARGFRRILRTIVMLAAAVALAWIWTDAIEMTEAGAARTMQSVIAAAATLFVAYLVWELIRLAIDRQLQHLPGGPKLPGTDDDAEATPGSRLQTMLPLLRAAFGGVIAVLAVLIVLSRLGIDTAPLIAGAGVFGLAVSFGSQSLVRDVISGLFYMWDDAFRVGEYIDTGRLKGTVETLGIRSLKLRHHNGPLHTIPYGQLGSVTNLSRDFATIKFNLRLEPATDIELVRRTAKQIGLAMQEDPDIAAEVILPLKLQGIAEVADNALVLRFKFTARPVKPSWIQREYLKRIYRVFAEKGIIFASGTTFVLQSSPTAPPGEAETAEAAEAVAAMPRSAPTRVA